MISGPDRIRLANHIVRSERTVLRVYQGRPCSPMSQAAVRRGAAELGLPLPPEPLTSGHSSCSSMPSPSGSASESRAV